MFGSSGDSISPEDLVSKNNNIYPTWTWTTGIKDADGKDISVTELINKYNALMSENKNLNDLLKSIEEDGTEEHNNAIKLREQNAQLKIDLDGWKKGVEVWKTQYDQAVAKNTKLEDENFEYKKSNKNWMNLYQEVVDKNNELLKEVNGLRHLKKENVELFERVNEVDSVVNERYRDEIFTLKNDIAVLKNRNTELLEKYNGFVTMGGQKYMEAKLQIVQNNYKKCAEERDEYKHQLNAANKENKALKNDKEYWKEQFDEVTELLHTLKKEYEERLKELNNSVVDVNNENKTLKKEKAILERWKHEQLIVNEMWDKVDLYVRDHDDAPLGGFTANTCLNFLKERDELKKRIDGLSLTIDRKNFEIDELKAEIKKLKEDIVDYVIEKDDELKKAQDWNNLNTNYYQCNHCGYKIAHNTNQWGGCACCKDGLMIEKTEEQKHPMYPIHWGGWDKVEITTSSTDKWQCPCNKCKDKRENKDEKSWEQAASDLALKIVKLEKQIEELKIVNICQKQS